MRALQLHRDQPAHELAANLRRAFSGIVAGNVKEDGIRAIERHGPYELAGDPAIMQLLDELLAAFVAQRRMKLPGTHLPSRLSAGRLRLECTARASQTLPALARDITLALRASLRSGERLRSQRRQCATCV